MTDLDGDEDFVALAVDQQEHGVLLGRDGGGDDRRRRRPASHRLLADLFDDVARTQALLGRRAVAVDIGDDDAVDRRRG